VHHWRVGLSDAREHEDDGVELAHWLQDSGHRKPVAGWVESLYHQSPAPPSAHRNLYLAQPTLLYLFALAALSYLIYYFVDVGLDITGIRSIIVFIRAHLGP